ncbi:MAG: histone deacetylase [Opitutales bacterium]|jgi:acetoin utilization deacetylase AcuC-like enzyme|nr:histone deacetylase [Opitutales bacterium]MBT5816555.1 histone deacetylase [Opitutales bacterium]MBT6380088.1 histone deacetylase [Opitutales bacterium]MBT6769770.1 histone deacetylase [Opitutales bacterium]MDG2254228.1 histone deacetylase [Opitutaceae bacterium]
MILFTHPDCLNYRLEGHPEKPERVEATVEYLKTRGEGWRWNEFETAPVKALLRAHPQEHLERLQNSRPFDADTAYSDDIYELARLATGATLAAMDSTLKGESAFSLMRPPGHHAEQSRAMGFCYLNHIAIAALDALDRGIGRVAVWDFDAHHGNGTEAILKEVENALYVSVHQHPCYPGTGAVTEANCMNFPVSPGTSPNDHMATLRKSWETILSFNPQLVLVSAGFDAYELDPLTEMELRVKDFETLGNWMNGAEMPVAGILEGGYSDDLSLLVDAFLRGWESR